jgi:ElaB/YqjD/DUF883 family membrane-anchored ribosome-binding protein
VLEEFTTDAQVVYDELSKELTITSSNVSQLVTPAATEAVEDTRTKIRKHPLLSMGLGVAAGVIVARWISKRR